MRCSNSDIARFKRYAPVGELHECWLWRGPCNDKGYGVFNVRKDRTGAHRAAYSFAFGAIPEGMHILHRCDNPLCVNPAHLRAGTHKENMREALERGRFCIRSGDSHPCSKLTAKQVMFIRSSSESGADLARMFGVSKSTIYAVRKLQNWRGTNAAA